MTFPTGLISTDNLTSGTSSPSLAREDLLQLVEAFNQLVEGVNQANGAVKLNGIGQIPATSVPAQQSPEGLQILSPSTGVVNIRNILRLQPRTTEQLNLLEFPAQGDVSYCSDGDAGDPCLAVYSGSQWQVVRLMTTIGALAATTLTATSALTCEVD